MLDPSQRYNHGFIHAHTRILKNIMKLGLRCPLRDFEFYVFLLFSHLNSSIPARFPIFIFLFYYFLSDQTEHCSGLNSPSPFQIDTFNIFFFFVVRFRCFFLPQAYILSSSLGALWFEFRKFPMRKGWKSCEV